MSMTKVNSSTVDGSKAFDFAMTKASSSNVIIESKKKEITTNVVMPVVDAIKAMDFADRIFRKMLISCGAGAAIYKYQDDKDEYIITLCELLIKRKVKSTRAAEAAINELQESRATFVPGPGEFVAMILRHQIGVGKLPDAKIAYESACNSIQNVARHKWIHDAVREAANRTNIYHLKTREMKDVFPQFKLHYEAVIDELTNGKTFTFKDEEIVPEARVIPPEERVVLFGKGISRLKAILDGAEFEG